MYAYKDSVWRQSACRELNFPTQNPSILRLLSVCITERRKCICQAHICAGCAQDDMWHRACAQALSDAKVALVAERLPWPRWRWLRSGARRVATRVASWERAFAQALSDVKVALVAERFAMCIGTKWCKNESAEALLVMRSRLRNASWRSIIQKWKRPWSMPDKRLQRNKHSHPEAFHSAPAVSVHASTWKAHVSLTKRTSVRNVPRMTCDIVHVRNLCLMRRLPSLSWPRSDAQVALVAERSAMCIGSRCCKNESGETLFMCSR